MSVDKVPGLIRQLYQIVAELEQLFPGQKFTPDGHMVGSIGEVLAAHRYGLELLPNSTKGHDAKTPDGRLVQIKATQRTSVALRSVPEHLIVLQLGPSGHAQEIYNGPGSRAWQQAGKMQKNGQRPISVTRLRDLMEVVPVRDRLDTVQ